MSRILLLLFLLCFAACTSRQKGEEIAQQDVRQVLIAYGQQNPEKEVLIETEFGNMRIMLYEETPLHRANFVKLIKEGHYADAEFYRVFYQFMIQGGNVDNQLRYRIPAEFNPKYIHKKGALSMARQDEDNPGRESSSTEFFIVHGSKYADYQADTEAENLGLTLTPSQRDEYIRVGGYMSLDQQYTVFGEVVEGLEVVDRIASVRVYNEDKPLKKIPLKISLTGK